MLKTLMKSVVVPLAALAIAGPATAKEAVIGLSPFGTVDQKKTEIRAVASHLLETLEPGETGWVVNAWTQEQIAEITIPTDPKKSKSMQRRMRSAPAFFANLKRFAENAQAPDSETFEGQIDLPGFLRAVGANYPADGARDLILYNTSPLTHDVRTPALSMKEGAVPDDASIAASRAENVYGAAGEAELLTNYTVHWGTSGEGWSLSDRHAHHLQRFLSLSVTERGASALATFATDPTTALRNATAGISDPVGAYAFKPGDEPTMITYQPVDIIENTEAAGSIYQRALSERIPSEQELTRAQNVEIAIRWTCDCDFDLAVQPVGGQPISYRGTRTTDGVLFKDHTSSASLNLGWETISLPGPIDLSTTTIAANLFRGPAGSQVEVRIAIDTETWGRSYVLSGAADGGSGFKTTLQAQVPANAAWVVIDPRALMGGV
ncbi:MAG: hypothetical protein AAF409_22435 [Pseudomonadota bacterium]